jgi:hypothetical protein
MSDATPDTEWARANRARFEISALTELVDGKQVQVGFTIMLFARLQMEKKETSERRLSGEELQAGLREIAKALTPPEGGNARLEIRPPRPAAILSPEGGLVPEVAVEANLIHGHDYFAEVTRAERDAAYAAIRNQLAERGLKEGQR